MLTLENRLVHMIKMLPANHQHLVLRHANKPKHFFRPLHEWDLLQPDLSPPLTLCSGLSISTNIFLTSTVCEMLTAVFCAAVPI